MHTKLTNVFRPTETSLLHARNPVPTAGGSANHWHTWLHLVWSLWIFFTPQFVPTAFPHWRWPTFISFAIFLWLFHHVYYRDRRHVLRCALAVAALGFAVTPLNAGAQGYLIYACAFLPYALPARRAVAMMLALLLPFSALWFWLDYPWLYLSNAVVIGLCIGLMNISFVRKMQADAALRLSHDEVRRLAALAERERIGRDLHDLLGHTLSLVAIKSELAGKLVERDPHAAKREIDEVSRVARDALAQVRRAVTGIRAAGLAAELASAKLLLETDAIALRYNFADVPLPPELETVFAMTLREAITNIQRHARAQAAQVDLLIEADNAVLRIADDGRGGAMVPGNGLCGMRERIEALGGRLRVDSTPDRGTRIEASLPLPPQPAVTLTSTVAQLRAG